jgi:DNA-binding NtrC family response regulator
LRIEVPPLRDRPEDIPLLVAHFVNEIAARLGRPAPEVDPATQGLLSTYAWPGNVRELRNVVERAVILGPPDRLTLDVGPVAAASAPAGATGEEHNLRQALERREREVLVDALKRSGGVRKEAARLLGIDQRNLGYYLRKHGVDPDAVGG